MNTKAEIILTIVLLAILYLLTHCTKHICLPKEADSVNIVLKTALNSSGFRDAQDSIDENTKVGLFIHEINVGLNQNDTAFNPFIINGAYFIRQNNITGSKISLTKNKRYRLLSYAPHRLQDSLTGYIKYEHGTDIIWSKSTFNIDKTNSIVNEVLFNFHHLTSQVTFKINDLRDELIQNLYPLDSLKFRVNGFAESFYLNIINGTIVSSIDNKTTSIDELNTPVFISPSTQNSTTELEIEIEMIPNNIDNVVINISKKLNYSFLPNHSYQLTINLSCTSMTVSVGLVDWQPNIADDIKLIS